MPKIRITQISEKFGKAHNTEENELPKEMKKLAMKFLMQRAKKNITVISKEPYIEEIFIKKHPFAGDLYVPQIAFSLEKHFEKFGFLKDIDYKMEIIENEG